MAVQKNKEMRRFVVLAVNVTESGQIIHIDRKIPAHLFRCKGILLSVKNCINTVHDIPHLGEVSLLLNSGQIHPFHHMVSFKREALNRNSYFVEISEKLVPNLTVNGFYRDSGKAFNTSGTFVPYCLNIYLDCLATE
jgi:hypothetical protein